MRCAFEIKGLSFFYNGLRNPVLNRVDLFCKRGDWILITGGTGSGKSTLLKTLNGIIPHVTKGTMLGDVFIFGTNTKMVDIPTLSKKVGLVFQSPETQLFCHTVRAELRFGPENLGWGENDIEDRVKRVISDLHLETFLDRDVGTLSGGEKQKIAVASVLSMGTEIVALDEPLSQLDPKEAENLIEFLFGLRNRGITLVLVEHRKDYLIPCVDRIYLLKKGVLKKVEKDSKEIFKKGFKSFHISKKRDEPLLYLKDVYFSYGSGFGLSGVNMVIKSGDVIALLGKNGSGKSTLIKILASIFKPKRGKVNFFIPLNKIGYVCQNADLMLISDTVFQELLFGPKNFGRDRKETLKRAEFFLGVFDLYRYKDNPPHSLSRGQRLKLAIASVLITSPHLLLLDEPTTGQDRDSVENIFETIVDMMERDEIRSVLFSTHDIDVALSFSTKILFMKWGKIFEIPKDTPKEAILKLYDEKDC